MRISEKICPGSIFQAYNPLNRCFNLGIPTGEASAFRKHPPQYRLFARFLSGIGTAVLFCLFMPVPHSGAVDLITELTAGYDSNPALNDPSDSSLFSIYGLGAGHAFAISEDLALDVSVEGRYQDYWSVRDNYSAQAGTELSHVLAGGRFLPSLVGEVAVYRDALIEAEERNWVMVGIRVDWILSPRLTLGFEQTFQWLDYLNRAKPFSGKGQGRQDGKGGKGGKDSSGAFPHTGAWHTSLPVKASGQGQSQLKQLYPARYNRLMVTGVDLDIYMLPSLTGRVYASYGDLNASLDMESYREIQAGAMLSWIAAAKWRVGIEVVWRQTEYNRVPDNITCVRRTNIAKSAGVQVSRFWGDVEFFWEAGWKAGDIPLDHESYTQTVVQCGLSYSF